MARWFDGWVRILALATVLLAHAGGTGLPLGWKAVSVGPAGGVVVQGRIPNPFVPADHRSSAIYLPPLYTPTKRYPVVYLLHGMAGQPASIWNSLHLAAVADRLIRTGQAQPFIAVMPVAGPTVHPNRGEWAGVWERYLVRTVLPWVDRHLSTQRGPRGRALEGLCAGGFGAVDIGLRHPGLFGTLGSWEGYFAPVFRDGPFARADAAKLRAHDPTLLLRADARSLRRSGVRFYLSAGDNHGGVRRSWTLAFARRLTQLRLPHRLWLLPPAERGHFWRATLPSALLYAAKGD